MSHSINTIAISHLTFKKIVNEIKTFKVFYTNADFNFNRKGMPISSFFKSLSHETDFFKYKEKLWNSQLDNFVVPNNCSNAVANIFLRTYENISRYENVALTIDNERIITVELNDFNKLCDSLADLKALVDHIEQKISIQSFLNETDSFSSYFEKINQFKV